MSTVLIHIAVIVAFVLVAIVLVWLAVRATRREPRRLSNGLLIGLAAVATGEALSVLGVPGADAVFGIFVLLAVLSPLLVVVLAALLIMNGLQMLRRESRGLGNLLSLLLGLGLLGLAGLPILLLLARGGVRGLAISGFFIAVAGYFGFLLLNFLVYAQIYRRLARNRPADWVVVLGSGLGEGGRVPPLLASRIRTGLAEAARRRVAVLVMSGGKGADEIRAEAEAMAGWAIENGADPSRILVENRSANTEQNLAFSAELLRQRQPMLTTGRAAPGEKDGLTPGLIVTSSYHAMRAAILARRLGIDAQAAGAPTAGYYWPSAVLREFVAVLAEHRWRHLVLSLVIAVPLPVLAFAVS